MAGGIYVIRGDDDLVEMTEAPFEKEELFQILLAKYPRVLGGDEFDTEAPRRWLLVTREAPIPSEEEGPNRWAVDHLFVDEHGVPTFVEVKRRSDTRGRREVVGQMLDYVSHAVITWRDGRLREHFETQLGEHASETFARTMGPDCDEDDFWQLVDTNLRAKKVRLVFVDDVMQPELRRIIEFMNEQMNPAEVLGIEIRQYVGGGLQTLVPRVVGRTAEALGNKGVPERGARWSPDRFFAEMKQRPPSDLTLARQLLEFAEDVSNRAVEWGTGKQRGSFTAKQVVGVEIFSLFSVYTDGFFSVNIGWNSVRLDRLGCSDLYESYRRSTNELFESDIDEVMWRSGFPRLTLDLLSGNRMDGFKELIRGMAEALKDRVRG